MPGNHVVVDGSNLATEGRSMPSLAQLDEAVRAYIAEFPDDKVTVVVDASFGYRIDESERAMFEEAEEAGELVSPPAGAIGRGDGFLLQIADRTGATVLSNDSFQEFHGQYEWLFDRGRLIGGKPVPGVGWIFSLRTPVRGPKSRTAVRDAKRGNDPHAPATKRVRPPKPEGPVRKAIDEATEDALEPSGSRRRSRSRRSKAGPPPEAVNEPLPFITFIANHGLGSDVEGEVEEFASHGAFITAGNGARCYVPLTAMGEPPPRSAREVLNKGERRTFVVQAFDAPRRGIELALPGFAHISSGPTEETVAAEIEESPGKTRPVAKKLKARPGEPRPRIGDTMPARDAAPAVEAVVEVTPEPEKPKRTRKKAAAPVVEAAPAPAKRTRKKVAAPVLVAAPAEEATPTKRTRKKVAAPTIDAQPVAEAAPAKRARKKAAAPEIEAAVVETPAPAPGKKRAAAKKAASATKAAAPKKAAPKKVATKKVAAAKKAAAKKTP